MKAVCNHHKVVCMGGDGKPLHAWSVARVRVAEPGLSFIHCYSLKADLFGAENRPQPQLNLAVSSGPGCSDFLLPPWMASSVSLPFLH